MTKNLRLVYLYIFKNGKESSRNVRLLSIDENQDRYDNSICVCLSVASHLALSLVWYKNLTIPRVSGAILRFYFVLGSQHGLRMDQAMLIDADTDSLKIRPRLVTRRTGGSTFGRFHLDQAGICRNKLIIWNNWWRCRSHWQPQHTHHILKFLFARQLAH